MSNVTGYIIFKIVPTVVVLLVAIYLAYVRLNPMRRTPALTKHKKGTVGYKVYEKIYSRQFLVIWSLIVASSIFDLVFDLYRSTHIPSLLVLTSVAILRLTVSLVVLYMLFRLFKKK